MGARRRGKYSAEWVVGRLTRRIERDEKRREKRRGDEREKRGRVRREEEGEGRK